MFIFIRNTYADDGKAKDGKTPEPPFIGDDGDMKDSPIKRRSRSILFRKLKSNKFLIDLADRDSITAKRKTSGGPSGSEGKSTGRGTAKGPRNYGGKQSPTPLSSDGQDGASESSLEKSFPKFVLI